MVVFLSWFLLFLPSPVVPGERLPEAGLEVAPEITLSILLEDNVLDLLFLVVLYPVTLLFTLLSSWANPTSYHYSDDPMDLTFKPRTGLQALGSSPSNPLFKSNLSHPHIYSPMVTFNEPSENVKGMFSFVHSCQFFPGTNDKLLLSSLIKR